MDERRDQPPSGKRGPIAWGLCVMGNLSERTETMDMRTVTLGALLSIFALSFGPPPTKAASLAELAEIPGGLAVEVGAIDAKLCLALAKTDRWITLVLARCSADADKIRSSVHAAGCAGLVTVGVWDGKKLPLADHMANLIVVDSSAKIAREEILRALVPVRGKALIRGDNGWTRLEKPMPGNLDGWTHFFHGPNGNKVSRDDAFRVPNGLRFIAGPRLQDSNGANGWRMDAGITASEWNYTLEHRERERKAIMLEARDAFNGVLLWQRAEWVDRGAFTAEKTKPLILADGRLLRIIDDGQEAARIGAVDPQTGETLRVYEASLNIRKSRYEGWYPQFNYHDGLIVQTLERRIRCIDAKLDRVIWDYAHDQGDHLARPVFAVDLGLVVVIEGNTPERRGFFSGRYPSIPCTALVAFDFKSGRLAWRVPLDPRMADLSLVHRRGRWDDKKWVKHAGTFHAVAYRDGRVFCLNANDANGGKPAAVWAVDAKAGKSLWVNICGPEGVDASMFDLFLLADGTLFTYGHSWARMDQATGELLEYGLNGGNARCDTGACTENLVTAGFGNYFDLSGDDLRWTKRDLARGQCGGWGTPAYGMMYYHGSGCGCFFPLRGNLALHHTREPRPIDDGRRLTKGPAYDRPLGAAAGDGDWPAYLYNGQRRGWGPQDGPRGLTEAWRVKISEPIAGDVTGVRQDWLNCGVYNGPVTAPVVAGGMLFVADRDRRRVVALDAATGRQRWAFASAGRVLTTPTYAQGRLVFGARDGNVYVLDAKTGELAWRFLAAPQQRYVLAYGQMEALWPVHGCLPVVDDLVVATAGYHGEADGGVWAWGLDLKSGEIVWSRRLQRPLRPWVTFETKQDREGRRYFSVSDEEHELATTNKSNGAYHPTHVRNIDLPMYDGEVAHVANHPIVIATGATSDRGVCDPLLIAGERYPFLDMEFENRGGPHSTGSVGIQLGGVRIGGHRSDGMRAAHNGTEAIYVEQTPDHTVGPGLCLIKSSDIAAEGWTRVSGNEKRTLTPIATSVNVVGKEADSLALGGRVAYVASEGHLMRPWGSQMRPRPRWRKGEAIPGHLEAFSVPDGRRLAHVEVDSAVINNGLAVAGGRLYAVCEDGTVRCYK